MVAEIKGRSSYIILSNNAPNISDKWYGNSGASICKSYFDFDPNKYMVEVD